MIKALLLDLDDTLLGNDLDTFMAGYFTLLSAYASARFDEQSFLHSLLQATRTVIHDTNPELTNDAVFWQAFEGLTGGTRSELEPFFQRFYETEFPLLRTSTVVRPVAASLVQSAIDRGLSVVIATNPLFPRVAIEQRLEWAGIPVTNYPYALVTAYENMHATKPQTAYYHEIVTAVGCAPSEALMVGDDWKNDISPAAGAGLLTYWIAAADAMPPDAGLIQGWGSLDALAERLADGWLTEPGARVVI
jgi:FMN phosphatase YigB (HAD superfamily)